MDWLGKIHSMASMDVEALVASPVPVNESSSGDSAIVGIPGAKALRIVASGDSRCVSVIGPCPRPRERRIERAHASIKSVCELADGC